MMTYVSYVWVMRRTSRKKITDLMYRASLAKERPLWMPIPYYEKLKSRAVDDPKFKHRSEVGTKNRMSGGVDGKAPPTHVLRRRSTTRVLKSLGGLQKVTPYQVLEKTKKNKQGLWISRRAEQIEADYNSKKARVEAGEITMGESQMYLESAGGFDKKGRLYGVGKAATEFYTLIRHRSGANDVPVYHPEPYTQLTLENEEL